MRLHTFFAIVVVLSITATTKATTLLDWDFFNDTPGGGTSASDTGSATGVQSTTLTSVNLAGGDTGSFGKDTYTVGGDGNLPHPAGYNPNFSDYVDFTVAPAPGDALTITDVDVSAGIQDADGTTGNSPTVSGWELRSSLDNYASDLGDIEGNSVDTTTISTINLIGFASLTTPAQFRLYPFGAPNGYETGSLGRNDAGSVDNGPGLYVDGSVVLSAPEPASLALMGVGCLTLLSRRRSSRAL
jgi:hypothetical protein